MTGDYHVYLGLGSNRDRPQRQLSIAVNHISRLKDTYFINSAPCYRTKAWGVTDQPDFINTVIAIKTRLAPMQLLKKIKTIEYRLMGRQHNPRWHSRCIDIDILYYADKPFYRPALQLPHTLMAHRCFVLRPLLDINPARLPRTVKQVMTVKKTHCLPLPRQRNVLENNKIQHLRPDLR